MPVIEELICIEQDGTISFGNYKLGQKAKKSDFEYQGDMYKVKTYNEITKLERNDMFVYESVPGTAAEHFKVTDEDVEFAVEGSRDAQITIQLENDTDYEVYVDGVAVGSMKTNMSGKLSVSVELEEGVSVQVKAVKRA
ncbi:endosialidase [Enterocloster clostridioformis]|uniref:endosialidase n=1 Tax=Enterocloster clostridioformis TaxID=1531 RepID=UPI00080C5387|nr:endosialidase [Enterocloster clostridioformis]ANU50015.1 endosialidase [Lachnoclostridium sp. YL32]NDO28491.1 endosialidase [Enterocloster clostridioformis]OXE70923.1 endosialidase [Enterocloster clostridioformis]QQR01078.1 endosialidase [Enterocloster clostridioformis]